MHFINLDDSQRKGIKDGKVLSEIKCWSKDCPFPLIVHGYPLYICENHHEYNDITGQESLWIPHNLVYYPLLYLGEILVARYQILFFPESKSRKKKEADRVYIDLAEIGKIIYRLLNITEDLKYGWSRETFQNHAGLRFSCNLMSRAIGSKNPILLDSLRGDLNMTVKKRYNLSAKELIEMYTSEQLEKMLITVQTYFNVIVYKTYLELMIAKKSFGRDKIPEFELKAWKEELKILRSYLKE